MFACPYLRNKVQAANRYILMNGKQTTTFLVASFCLLAGRSRKSHHDDALTLIRLAASLQARSIIDTFENLPIALPTAGLSAAYKKRRYPNTLYNTLILLYLWHYQNTPSW